MERSPRGAIESVTASAGDDVGVLTDPVDVAVECCEFSARRMSTMQPKWFRKYAATDGHTVWVAAGNRTRHDLVKKIDNTTYTTRYSMTAMSTRPAGCVVKRCVWSGSSNARSRLRKADGSSDEARLFKNKRSGPRGPVTLRASRHPPTCLTTLRCSFGGMARVVPVAGVQCLVSSLETTAHKFCLASHRSSHISSGPSAGRLAKRYASQTTRQW